MRFFFTLILTLTLFLHTQSKTLIGNPIRFGKDKPVGCFQRWNPIKKIPQQVYHSNWTQVLCKDIVQNPKPDVIDKLCLCDNGKWKPLTYGGIDGKVDIQFFGDILGHAKTLCSIFEAIDCWQSNPKLPKIPFLSRDMTNYDSIISQKKDLPSSFLNNTQLDETLILKLIGPDNTPYYTSKFDIINTVKQICKVINGGIDTLPGLLPIKDRDGNGKGLGSLFGFLGKLLEGALGFFDIFQISNRPEDTQKIQIFNNLLIASSNIN